MAQDEPEVMPDALPVGGDGFHRVNDRKPVSRTARSRAP
jgi:hypothetical protein